MEERNMNMTELQQELDEVWKLVSMIPVKGDSVEIMAAVRAGLRRAYGMAEASTEKDGGNDGR